MTGTFLCVLEPIAKLTISISSPVPGVAISFNGYRMVASAPNQK
jgi:hypothetical protein